MIEVWGGIECTINRIKDSYYDQLTLNGHYERENDLLAFAKLGIKSLRYPLLWEKHQPQRNGSIDWLWADKQLGRLKEYKITPIIGLLHHGSGPDYTDLLQEDFPEMLASYAGKVAARFPWVENYTPVNEPLTTARFSGLYGLWYPHKNNDVSFIKILLNELKAVVLSMRAIREVNPAAKLVQTEDLGKTYSTGLLEYQARFENHRRWLTSDILCGRFNEEHPLWNYFKRLGISQKSLDFFLQNPCPPDIMGVNHYVTSERYLDEDVEKFPAWAMASNGIHTYADVEAVRVKLNEPVGIEVLLKEMWDRYNIPIAITEVHLHCSRDEQLRWFKEIYDVAERLNKTNVDVRAVTAWSLLGAFGWNRLLTEMPGDYETGAFDISKGTLRETALAGLLKAINKGEEYKNNILLRPGWWHRNSRFYSSGNEEEICESAHESLKPVLIIGKNGSLGKAFARLCDLRSVNYKLVGRDEVDIASLESIDVAIKLYQPWAIINASGYEKVEEAQEDETSCFRENTLGSVHLASKCAAYSIKLVTFSTDLVFDGKKNSPYLESDELSPLSVYGESKELAEKYVTRINPAAIIVRTSALFGPWDKNNFIDSALSKLRRGEPFTAPADVTVSPTYLPHLVNAVLDLLIDDESGIWHLANRGSISWYEFAREAAIRTGLNEKLVRPSKMNQRTVLRPRYSALDSEKGILMPTLEKALDCYFHDCSILVK